MHNDPEIASEWVRRWADLVTTGPVLDVASGAGRHAVLFAERGLEVVAVDREPRSIPGVRCVQADLDPSGQPAMAILHRPLFPAIEAALAEDGVLVYETFMMGNEKFGRPSNPAFLLRPAELLQAFPRLTPVAFEQGYVERPKPAMIQRLCATRGHIRQVKIAP